MTIDEYRNLTKNILTKLPGFNSWLRKFTKSDQKATCMSWFDEIFSTLELDTCKIVLASLVRGDIDKPFWGDLATTFRTHCSQLTYEQRIEKEKEQHHSAGTWNAVTQGPLMRDLFKATLEARKQARADGDDPDAVASMTARRMMKDMPVDMRDARKCRQCDDTGWVICWDVRTMAQVRRVPKEQRDTCHVKWRSCSVVCDCDAGTHKWPVRKNKAIEMQDLPIFDKQQWVPVADGKEALWLWSDNYMPPNANDFGGYGIVVGRNYDF
jgi:hypothetical protein